MIAAGIFLTAYSYLSMNAIEPLIWLGCVILLVRLIKTGNTRLWLGFGVLAGIGLLNKNTMLMFGFSLLAGLLLTSARKFDLMAYENTPVYICTQPKQSLQDVWAQLKNWN